MKTFVIKIDNSMLSDKQNRLDGFKIADIASQVSALRNKKDIGVVLVVSGSVACGQKFINLPINDKNFRQLAAGVGQAFLTSVFNRVFLGQGLQIAQILLTKSDLDLKSGRPKKIADIINLYISSGFIPFINENDVLDLNSFGGDDLLAADIAMLLGADHLILFSSEQSEMGVSGKKTEQKAVKILSEKNIKINIFNKGIKDILLENI